MRRFSIRYFYLLLAFSIVITSEAEAVSPEAFVEVMMSLSTSSGIASSTTSSIRHLRSGPRKNRDFVLEYLAAHLEILEAEAAQGEGEHLQVLSHLMQCPASVYTTWMTLIKQKYAWIFEKKSSDISSQSLSIYYKLQYLINQNLELQKACVLSHQPQKLKRHTKRII